MGVPTKKSELEAKLGADLCKIGFSKAMKSKWISLAPGSKDEVVK